MFAQALDIPDFKAGLLGCLQGDIDRNQFAVRKDIRVAKRGAARHWIAGATGDPVIKKYTAGFE
jgi:hypothetical protein